MSGVGEAGVRFPSDLEYITEAKFPFTETEKKEGVRLVKDSVSHQIWELITGRDSVLRHPYSDQLGTIEDLSRECAAVCETEISLHAQYCSLADRVAFLDAKTRDGVEVPGLNRAQLMKDSDVVFRDWELSRLRAKQLRQRWVAYRNDRVNRIEKAIELYKQLHASVDASATRLSVGEWEPSSRFARALQIHAQTLKAGINMTSYYVMQNCVAKLTGRPLFLSTELSRSGGLAARADTYYMGPIEGGLQERMTLLSVAN
jgi:hypothetical protein